MYRTEDSREKINLSCFDEDNSVEGKMGGKGVVGRSEE